MGESKLLLALFCNKILTKSEQGVVVVVISWRSGCVTLTVTLQLYRGGECVRQLSLFVMQMPSGAQRRPLHLAAAGAAAELT